LQRKEGVKEEMKKGDEKSLRNLSTSHLFLYKFKFSYQGEKDGKFFLRFLSKKFIHEMEMF
jgi:hypothetical protein